MAVTEARNAVVADPMRAAMEAISRGEDAMGAVYGGGSNAPVSSEPAEPAAEPGANPLDSIEELETQDTEENSAELEASQLETAKALKVPETSKKASASKGNTEEVFVKGVDGKRQAIKIDYTDRESIKQAFLKAAGMRKFQLERDKVTQEHKKFQGDFEKLKKDMDVLEDVYSKQGVKGLISKLGGDAELKKLVDDELRHREYMQSLTPQEKSTLEFKQREEETNKKLADTEARFKQLADQIASKEDQATTRSLESRLHPAFDRYRFSGKLGDDMVEHQLDETVWNQATKRLAEYPDDVELTQAIVDKEFRAVAQNLQKVITVQAEKKVQKTVDKKKSEAAQAAQVVAKKGLSTGGAAKEKFVDSIKSGDIMGALAQMTSGKIKL